MTISRSRSGSSVLLASATRPGVVLAVTAGLLVAGPGSAFAATGSIGADALGGAAQGSAGALGSTGGAGNAGEAGADEPAVAASASRSGASVSETGDTGTGAVAYEAIAQASPALGTSPGASTGSSNPFGSTAASTASSGLVPGSAYTNPTGSIGSGTISLGSLHISEMAIATGALQAAGGYFAGAANRQRAGKLSPQEIALWHGTVVGSAQAGGTLEDAARAARVTLPAPLAGSIDSVQRSARQDPTTVGVETPAEKAAREAAEAEKAAKAGKNGRGTTKSGATKGVLPFVTTVVGPARGGAPRVVDADPAPASMSMPLAAAASTAPAASGLGGLGLATLGALALCGVLAAASRVRSRA